MKRATEPVRLDDLGVRICIMGPSNSGKSTLAAVVGRTRGFPVVHLDQLYHLPNTDWRPRAEHDFLDLHDLAILGERWIMEGNYSRCLPARLERATGVIVLGASTATSLVRYLRRSWLERDRLGGLEGSHDSVKWEMIRQIAITTRRNRQRDADTFERIGLPKIRLATRREIAGFYKSERLTPFTSQERRSDDAGQT